MFNVKHAKLVGAGLSMATILGLTIPVQAANIYQEVVLGPYSTTGMVMPSVTISSNDSIQLLLLNPSPDPLTFSVPDFNTSVVIPPNSQRTVNISPDAIAAANLMPGEQVAYTVTGPGGQQLASGTFVNDADTAALADITSYEYLQTANVPFQDEEPTYTTAAPSQQTSAVRGYW